MNDLTKLIDSKIDELFAKSESTMMKDQKPAKETADEAMKQVPKAEKDEARGAGRPEQISSIPQTDTDGSRSGEYDADVAKKQEDAKKKEDSQVEVPSQMKKSLTDAEYEEFQILKAEKAAKAQAETLEKARRETTDLIKSAVSEAVAAVKAEHAKEVEALRKSSQETADLVKSMANKPQKSKSITAMNVAAVEKFQKSEGSNTLSKSEVLDIAEELVKSKHLSMESVIELENTGFIYDPEARRVLESAVKRRS